MFRAVLIDPERFVMKYVMFTGGDKNYADVLFRSLGARNVAATPLRQLGIAYDARLVKLAPLSDFRDSLKTGRFMFDIWTVEGRALIIGETPNGDYPADSPSIEQLKPYVKRCL